MSMYDVASVALVRCRDDGDLMLKEVLDMRTSTSTPKPRTSAPSFSGAKW